MNKKIYKTLIVFICIFLLNACSDYEDVEKKGLKSIPQVISFNKLFTSTEQEIGYLRGIGDNLIWKSVAIVYKRYRVAMHFDISVDFFNTPKMISKPTYSISENKFIIHSGEKRYVNASLGSISADDWSKVKKIDDIFKILKITPIKDKL